MMNKGFLVAIGTRLTNLALKLHLPVEGIIKKTIFKMFCGGTSKENCLPIIKEMHEMNVHSVLDFSSEEKRGGRTI